MGKWTKWSADKLAMLGTASDADLAGKWGLPADTVAHARIRRGIAAFQAQKRWTDEERALLGTMPDSQLAKLLGRTRQSVQFARRERGIKLVGSQPHPRLEGIKHAYTSSNAPVAEIAQKYGVAPHFIYKRVAQRGWTRPGVALSMMPKPHVWREGGYWACGSRSKIGSMYFGDTPAIALAAWCGATSAAPTHHA